VSERIRLHVETVDAPNWHAVLVMQEYARLEPSIVCIGFATETARDNWLSWFAPSVRNLAESLPSRLR
jgi:hypothetical protein